MWNAVQYIMLLCIILSYLGPWKILFSYIIASTVELTAGAFNYQVRDGYDVVDISLHRSFCPTIFSSRLMISDNQYTHEKLLAFITHVSCTIDSHATTNPITLSNNTTKNVQIMIYETKGLNKPCSFEYYSYRIVFIFTYLFIPLSGFICISHLGSKHSLVRGN